MDQIRIIKKYPNRRLYDSTISRYITLDEIKELVLKHVKFKVVDADTEEDVTDYVLLQIIIEKESGSSPIFTTEILQNLIRFYGNPLQKMLSEFLEKSFSSIVEKQNDFQKFIKQDNPFNAFVELTKQNVETWQNAFDQYVTKPKTKKRSKKT